MIPKQEADLIKFIIAFFELIEDLKNIDYSYRVRKDPISMIRVLNFLKD